MMFLIVKNSISMAQDIGFSPDFGYTLKGLCKVLYQLSAYVFALCKYEAIPSVSYLLCAQSESTEKREPIHLFILRKK